MTVHSSTFDAMCEAIDDEYKALATYNAVIAQFGPVLPFANIARSEQCHIDALMYLFASRGWTPPEDRWSGTVAAPESVKDACRVGVEAEIENAALYDRLFAMTDDAEVIQIFTALRRASAEHHLPAFQRCYEGDMSSCCSGGGGHHHGQGHQGGGRCCAGRRGSGRCAA